MIDDYLSMVSESGKNIPGRIYKYYRAFGYSDPELFRIDLDFLAQSVYGLRVGSKINKNRDPNAQANFRTGLLKQYNNSCVISESSCEVELDAAHITPHKKSPDFSLSNGLVLKKDLHGTFDKYLWSINPWNLTVEISEKYNSGEIAKYKGNLVNLVYTPELFLNLLAHYHEFTEHEKLNN